MEEVYLLIINPFVIDYVINFLKRFFELYETQYITWHPLDKVGNELYFKLLMYYTYNKKGLGPPRSKDMKYSFKKSIVSNNATEYWLDIH